MKIRLFVIDRTTRMAGLRFVALPFAALGVRRMLLLLIMIAKLVIFLKITSVFYTIIFLMNGRAEYPENNKLLVYTKN